MKKLIVIDLDGTLLNEYGVITEETKKYLKELKKQDVEIVLASGRPMDAIMNFAKQIECENYFIAGNGALIYSIKENKIIYENTLKPSKILEIAQICEENSIAYNIYTENTIIAKQLKANVLYYYNENLRKEEKEKTSITIVEDIIEYIRNFPEKNFLKITVCDESEAIFKSVVKKLEQVEDVEMLDVEHISRKTIKQGTEEFEIKYYYTEISASNVDKWEATKIIMDKMNILPENVIAIGDNMNDKKMIQNAQIGIAMGQSDPRIKEVATYITETNENEGVKKAIEKYLKFD